MYLIKLNLLLLIIDSVAPPDHFIYSIQRKVTNYDTWKYYCIL